MCQCGKSNRRPHVIGEDQEGPTERDEATVQRDAVERRAHGVLTHSIMEVAAGSSILDLGVVRAGEIGRPAR